MRDYAFYGLEERPRRLGLVVVPTRRLLRRLLRPMLFRQETLLRDLGETLDRLAASYAELAQRHEELARSWAETNHLAVVGHQELVERWADINHRVVVGQQELRNEMSQAIRQLEQDTGAVAAIGWDHLAVTRRLAAIEDRLGDD